MHRPSQDARPSVGLALPPTGLRCPLCGKELARDPLWASPHWLCPNGHSYSNLEVLQAALRERAMTERNGTSGRARRRRTAG